MSVALNISGNNIKVLLLKGRHIKKWASASLPEGLVRDGLILQPKAVGEAAAALFKSAGIRRENVVTSVAGLSFTYRFIKLPRMKQNLLDEAIIRAARKEISLPLDELYLSWQQLPDAGNELSFFVIGVPRNLIDAMLETLKIAGIEPYLMGLRPLALARTGEISDAIIVNLESDCFDIVFMSGGIPMVIHTITPRGQTSTLEDNIRRLADELTKTAAFFQSNHPEAQFGPSTPLLLTGELAEDSLASALLQTEVEYPIGRLVAQVEIPEGFPMDSFAATIGLALKKTPQKTAARAGVNFTDVNINILAGKYRKPKAKPVSMTSILAWVLLAAAIIAVYPLYNARTQARTETAALAAQLGDIKRQVNIATLINEDNTMLENEISTVSGAAQDLKNAYAATLGFRGEFTGAMALVTTLMPAALKYTAMDITHTEIHIYGEAGSASAVIDYVAALEASGKYFAVRINELAEVISSFPADSPLTVMQFEIIIQKYAPEIQ